VGVRAAVLGWNDAMVSTASLMMGVAAGNASRESILVAGGAALVAGAMSMAVGEYVSVSTQRDIEEADIAREKRELAETPQAELLELAAIYRARGLSDELAKQVAQELTAHDALAAHVRDELGIEEIHSAQPLQAAWASALGFSLFALIPIFGLLVAPNAYRLPCIAGISLLSLALLGVTGAQLGGASRGRAALRVLIGGAFAMGLTALIGKLLGVSVA